MNAADKITEAINQYDDWRGDLLRELRQLINDTSPELTEDFKWSVPVWTHHGLICAISGFKDHVKINFFKGAFLPDPTEAFNSGKDSKEHRSINLTTTDKPNHAAIKALIKEAIAYNK